MTSDSDNTHTGFCCAMAPLSRGWGAPRAPPISPTSPQLPHTLLPRARAPQLPQAPPPTQLSPRCYGVLEEAQMEQLAHSKAYPSVRTSQKKERCNKKSNRRSAAAFPRQLPCTMHLPHCFRTEAGTRFLSPFCSLRTTTLPHTADACCSGKPLSRGLTLG